MAGVMSRPRLLLLLGSTVATALMIAAIAADWAGKSMIDQRTFNALIGATIALWICYSIATCTGIVIRQLAEQESTRAARVAAAMTDNGLGDLQARQRAAQGR